MEASHIRFNRLSIFCHWAGALVMLIILLSAELRYFFESQGLMPMRLTMMLHIGAGMIGLFLLVPRIVARFANPTPVPIDNGSSFKNFLAKAVHLMLYLLLIASPLIGWVIVNAKGFAIPMPFLGFDFPLLVLPDPELVKTTVLIHQILGRAFYGLIGLHVAATCWHHFVKKDAVLYRMYTYP